MAGCAFLIRPKAVYEIENRTAKDLTLKVFSKSSLLNSITIKSFSTFDTTMIFSGEAGAAKPSTFNEEIVDFLVMLFSDNKLITYYCSGKLWFGEYPDWSCYHGFKNPMFFDFNSSSKFRPRSSYNYIIEESDYLNAKQL
jgi:hypothetical protein